MDDQKLTLNQLIILSMLFENRKKTSEIAGELSMTKQGIMYHLRTLRNRGLINAEEKVTREGYEVLHNGLSDLRDYLTESLGRIDMALTWEAVSDESFTEGDVAYLSMKDGYLHATKRKSETASGVAAFGTEPGEIALVDDIEGLVKLSLGSIIFYVISDRSLLGSDLTPNVREKNAEITGIIGEGALVFCRKRNLKVDMEFGSLNGAFDACTRGLNARIFVSDRRFRFLLHGIEELSRTYPQVTYRIEYL